MTEPTGRSRQPSRTATALLRSVYLPRAADSVAFAMTTYGIPLLVLAATGSPGLTGLAFALEWLPRLGAFVVAGTLVDRLGTAQVFRAACVLRALVVLTAALLLVVHGTGALAEVIVMVLAPVSGVLTEFSYVAAETAGGEASRTVRGRAHQVQSVLLGIDQSAMLAGPVVSGLLLEYGGPAVMLGMLAGFSLLAAALSPRQRHNPIGSTSEKSGLRAGWQTLRSLPGLAWLVGGLLASNVAIGLLQAAMPVIVVTELGRSSSDAGLIWSAAALASLLAVTAARRAIDRWGLWPVGTASARHRSHRNPRRRPGRLLQRLPPADRRSDGRRRRTHRRPAHHALPPHPAQCLRQHPRGDDPAAPAALSRRRAPRCGRSTLRSRNRSYRCSAPASPRSCDRVHPAAPPA